MEFYYLSALGASLLCFFIIGICVCRLNLCKGSLRPRIKYTALILAASVAGLQPYYAEQFPGAGAVALAGCVIWLLVDGAPAWRRYRHIDHPMETQIFDPDTDGGDDD